MMSCFYFITPWTVSAANRERGMKSAQGDIRRGVATFSWASEPPGHSGKGDRQCEEEGGRLHPLPPHTVFDSKERLPQCPPLEIKAQWWGWDVTADWLNPHDIYGILAALSWEGEGHPLMRKVHVVLWFMFSGFTSLKGLGSQQWCCYGNGGQKKSTFTYWVFENDDHWYAVVAV